MNNFSDYLQNFKNFNFRGVSDQFQLIEQDSESVFVPLSIPMEDLSKDDIQVVEQFKIPKYKSDHVYVSGKDVWDKYVDVVTVKTWKGDDYYSNQIRLKKIYGLLSKFMFSAFSNQIDQIKHLMYYDEETSNYSQYGIHYLADWEGVYSYESGLDLDKVKNKEIFL